MSNRVGLNRQRVLTIADSEFGQNETGGLIRQARAAATLTVGQAVITDANGEVATNATAANGVLFAGIVVGGRRTDMKALLASTHVGTQAALADETVLIMYFGVCYGVADDTITINTRVGLAATAGQVNDATGTEYSIGTALSAGVNDGPVLLLLNGVQVEVSA